MKNKLFTVRPSSRPLFHLLILSILSSCILSSCTSTKLLQKNKTEINTEISTTENATSHNQLISVTKVTESFDTSFLLKGTEFISSANLNILLSGDTIKREDEYSFLKTYYDSLANTIRTQFSLKPHSLKFKFEKLTEKQELKTSSAIAISHNQSKQALQSENKKKEISSSSIPWLAISFVFIVISVILLILFTKLKIKF